MKDIIRKKPEVVDLKCQHVLSPIAHPAFSFGYCIKCGCALKKLK